MGESSDSVSIDIETIQFGGKEFFVKTSWGSICVSVCGDQKKPALITYPDVALNYILCFQGLFCCSDADCLLFENFCIYHINPPGHELGADSISSEVPFPSMDDLADQVAEVLDFFGIKEVFCLGVTAGAYILTLFAMKYRERARGLILVSPLCRTPSLTEWFHNKVMLNLLYFFGLCGLAKDFLLHRYFSEEVRCGIQREESDIVQASWRLLDSLLSSNVARFLTTINQRKDITGGLKELQCKTLIIVGEDSPFYSESLHMNAKMSRKNTTILEVKACGSLVTEEQPDTMFIAIEFFLMGFGIHRKPPMLKNLIQPPNHPLPSSNHICLDLLSPESLGIKLKPIKTHSPKEV